MTQTPPSIAGSAHAPDHADVAIITIKQEEFDAVLKRFPDRQVHPGRRRSYVLSTVSTSAGEVSIAVVRCVEQGESPAQQAANDVIDDLDPEWILVVGIAGAFPASEFGLGDVMLASRIHDFSVTAALEGKPVEVIAGGGPVHPRVEDLLSVLPAQADLLEGKYGWNSRGSLMTPKPRLFVPEDLKDKKYYGNEKWREKVRKSLKAHFGTAKPRKPRLWIGSVASGNTLVKDTKLAALWRRASREITHIEMELGGVYRAARRRDYERPVLGIRGLSDIVGYDRGDEWTDFACHSAASFAYTLLRSGVLQVQNAPHLRSALERSVLAYARARAAQGRAVFTVGDIVADAGAVGAVRHQRAGPTTSLAETATTILGATDDRVPYSARLAELRHALRHLTIDGRLLRHYGTPLHPDDRYQALP